MNKRIRIARHRRKQWTRRREKLLQRLYEESIRKELLRRINRPQNNIDHNEYQPLLGNSGGGLMQLVCYGTSDKIKEPYKKTLKRKQWYNKKPLKRNRYR